MPFRFEQQSATKALLNLRNADGGIPAVRSNNESGCWTTADVLYDVLVAGSISAQGVTVIRELTEFLVNRQLPAGANGEPAGGWPLALGARASTMATGQAVAALELTAPFLDYDAGLATQIINAIENGFRWLDWAQDAATGGWGTEPSAGGEGSRPTILATFYALLAYFERGDDAASPGVVRRATDFIQSSRNAGDGSWSAKPDLAGDASNTARSLSILIRSQKLQVSDPSIQKGLEFILKARKIHGLWDVAQEPFFFADAGGYIHYHQNTICDVVVAFADCEYHGEPMRTAVNWLLSEQQQQSKLWHLSSPQWTDAEIQTWSTAEWVLALDFAERSFARKAAIECPPTPPVPPARRVIQATQLVVVILLVICAMLWIGGGSFFHAGNTIDKWWTTESWLRYVVGTLILGGLVVAVIAAGIYDKLKARSNRPNKGKVQ